MGTVLDEARGIVESYDIPITLRQLFYRLVAKLLIPNTRSYYQRLSEYTAAARRDGTFPDLVDRNRSIHEPLTFRDPADAINDLVVWYRRDRTEGQPVALYLGVEKDGMVGQLNQWFGQRGFPILALSGYASQSFCDDIVRHVRGQDRPAVLLYAGDHDPTGWDIPRDFTERTGCWKDVIRVALDPQLVEQYQLPEAVDNDPLTAAKLERDSRARGFIARFGRLTQVEMDALDPTVLRELFETAIERYWSRDIYEAVMAREADERAQLADLARTWES